MVVIVAWVYVMYAPDDASSTTRTSTWSSVTKYRRKAMTDTILTRREEIMREIRQDLEADLKQFNGEEDHVHPLVHYPPKVLPTVRLRAAFGWPSPPA
jgi:REP element-mobilizing transposase RayT